MDLPSRLSDGDLENARSSCSLVAELAWAQSSSYPALLLHPGSQECAVSSLERTSVLVFSPSSSVFPTSQVLVTMRSLQLLRTPSLCALLWAFCALGARAEEPGASFSHPGSVGLDKSTVHDQEYVFSRGCGPGASPSAAAASCKGTRSPTFLLLFVRPLNIFQG